MIVRKPPSPHEPSNGRRTVFLAGSIDMGSAEDWQGAVTAELRDLDIVVLNPRRDDWDASWRQSIDDPQFRAQVEWELDGLERADVIALWLARDSLAPISLLELGLFARGGKVVIGCPQGFWRRGNVEVVSARYQIPLFDELDAFVTAIRKRAAG
ncbi:MAG: nucleoside 2-deoxyribosyltransferase domain-containing protein, partial [Myxococcales bacterium]|nr:nucleoside 2-deoxyribosyltransferase domain-containing protein [Myxococcales bacterium]